MVNQVVLASKSFDSKAEKIHNQLNILIAKNLCYEIKWSTK